MQRALLPSVGREGFRPRPVGRWSMSSSVVWRRWVGRECGRGLVDVTMRQWPTRFVRIHDTATRGWHGCCCGGGGGSAAFSLVFS
eukprot:4962465-Prymnesium_polylepis.1